MASKPPKPPDAFLSYTRFDDRHDGGAISEFRRRLADSVRAVTGEPFEIFQDVDGIGLGEHWPGKLDEMLQETRFFIPILTPSFFRSQACRDELEKFLKAEKDRGRNDLVLPIYYIRCRLLEDPSLRENDPLASAIHERQREDWRERRFKPFEDPEVRRSLEALAHKIDDARSRAEEEEERERVEAELRAKEEEARRRAEEAARSRAAEEQRQLAEEAEAKRRAEQEKEERERAEAERKAKEAEAGRQAEHRRAEEPPAARKNEVDRSPQTNTETSRERKASKNREPSMSEILESIRSMLREEAPEKVYRGEIPRLSDTGKTPEGQPSTHFASLDPGTVFRDIEATWCPELVVIPPGEFMMGSPDNDPDASEDEKPQHLVRIAYSLAVGRFPVTFEEYDHFAAATQPNDKDWLARLVAVTRGKHPNDPGWGRGRRPVINVSWVDAKAYVEWLAGETGLAYRLLSEAEWEYTCRAGSTMRYWWGDETMPEKANYSQNLVKTSEAGSYPASPFGLYDMHGNVWEWVEDCWNDSYKNAPGDGSAWSSGDCDRRVLRGGSWYNFPGDLRSASRLGHEPDIRGDSIGFRVARTLSRSGSVTS